MSPRSLTFGLFVLDPKNRQLTRDGVPVELSSRYFDALSLLVREQGELISKDRFLQEVWKGVPVTDEAITQCIKTLRKQLGDEASNPRYIETVPKHGYRFIATMKPPTRSRHDSQSRFPGLVAAGAVGGGLAGVIGGLLYGFLAASQALSPGTGAISVLLVVLSITILIALVGGTGVGFGLAMAGRFFRHSLLSCVAGGALGGMVVGAVVKLLSTDAFNLLFGKSPGDIAGATEGLLLGGAVGLGAWLVKREGGNLSAKRAVVAAALSGAGAGIVIALLGGRLMVGSLELLVRQFSGSRLQLDQIGLLFGEDGYGNVTQIVMGGMEGALFAGSIVIAILIVRGRPGLL